ncbi:hypothetical protein [Peterkaempfera griseoplana]|uniref:hypothetical protein n=1 Tax=Peterkaempfera griseoplana TaxID=66896 RepID=UPI0006E2D1FD|nr:hypothetical protein [Peterkaempfera griseoplana]
MWVALWLVGTVSSLLRGSGREAVAILGRGLLSAGGSLATGALLGVATGAALAVAPSRLIARGTLRCTLAALVGGVVFLGEVAVVAVTSDGGYGPVLLTLAAVPVVAGTTAAYSGDIAGHTRRHAWLRTPGAARSLAALLSAQGGWRSKAHQALKLLW